MQSKHVKLWFHVALLALGMICTMFAIATNHVTVSEDAVPLVRALMAFAVLDTVVAALFFVRFVYYWREINSV